MLKWLIGFGLLGVLSTPAFTLDHATIRTNIVELQAGQIGPGQILFAGDSNIEAIWQNSICGRAIINGGIAGANVETLESYMPRLLGFTRPIVVTLLIGVNNSQTPMPTDPLIWSSTYDNIVDMVVKTGATLVPMTIMPVEKDRGSRSFDLAAIKAYNAHIRTVAKDRRLHLVDTNKTMAAPDGFLAHGDSFDGVHLTGEGYKRLFAELEQATTNGLRARGLSCQH